VASWSSLLHPTDRVLLFASITRRHRKALASLRGRHGTASGQGSKPRAAIFMAHFLGSGCRTLCVVIRTSCRSAVRNLLGRENAYAAFAISRDQLNVVSSTQIRCRMIASLHATAVIAATIPSPIVICRCTAFLLVDEKTRRTVAGRNGRSSELGAPGSLNEV
jgi:hypothetical protein